MAKTVYIKIGLTGGTSNDVDGIDGSGLLDGDVIHAYIGNVKYEYVLDDDLSGILDSPFIINPVANPGTKSWVLQVAPVAAGGTGATTATASLDSISPLTTKGDLLGFSTVNTRIATAATDNYILITDASVAHGFRYKNGAASATTAGLIEIATYAEVNAGTDDVRAITPARLVARVASTATAGIIEVATYAETQTATDTGRVVTPYTLGTKVASATTPGIIRIATYAETNVGTAATASITPARLAGRVASPTTAGLIEIATSAEVVAMTDTARAVTPDGLGDLLQYAEETIWASAFVPGTSASASFGSYEWATNDICRDYFSFASASDTHIRISHIFPETWDQGTIKAKFISTGATPSSATDHICWAIKGRCSRDDDAIDAAWGTAVTVGDDLTADGPTDNQISAASAAITLGGTAATGCVVDFDIYRDVSNDGMNEAAWLFAVKFEYKNTKAKIAW